jgi:hypothetical protein
MISISDIQKIVPWAAALPLLPKIILTLVIISSAVLMLLLIWLPDPSAIHKLEDPKLLPKVDNQPKEGLRVEAAYVSGSVEAQRRFFDVTIANYNSSPEYLTKFLVKWVYHKGMLSSIEHGEVLVPESKHSVKIDISPEDSGIVKEQEVPINPLIVLPASGADGPSIFTLRVELYYNFDSKGGLGIDYHTTPDWNIEYDIDIVNNASIATKAISGSWKNPQSPVHLEPTARTKEKFVEFDKITSDTAPKKAVVKIDQTHRRFKFIGGEKVTIKVINGDNSHKLFLYGYLPTEVTSLNNIRRLGPNDNRIFATLSSGQEATFRVPNSNMEFELQGVKVLAANAASFQDDGEICSTKDFGDTCSLTIEPLDQKFSNLSGVSMVGILYGFTILVTWEET